MMNACRWLLFALIISLGSAVHAEGECPPGMFPTNPQGTQGPVGCAPIPGYNNNQQQAQPQSPPAEWVSRWGAVATDGAKGSLGTSANAPSAKAAELAAMTDCLAKGGLRCKVDISYRNGCAAIAQGDGGYNVESAATVEQAAQSSMKVCSKAGRTNCQIFYTACSLPIRIQ